jgi:hypothetical protein
MLRTTKDLEQNAILATDGTIGEVKDLYFDDHTWVLRYLVVETGHWLSSRKVLISPVSIARPHGTNRTLSCTLSKKKVRDSPTIDTDKPVSRQHEASFLDYYGYPYYWNGLGYWGDGLYPAALLLDPIDASPSTQSKSATNERNLRKPSSRNHKDNPHLRSCNAVTGYHIEASDGELGHVQGMIFDDETWALRYLVVETSNWWIGHRVLVAPQWIERISWGERTVKIKMTRQSLKDAPTIDSVSLPDRALETTLYDRHGLPGYWLDESEPEIIAPVV